MTIDASSTKLLSKQGDVTLEDMESMASSLMEMIGIGIVNGKIKVDVLLHGLAAPTIPSIVADGGNGGPDEATVSGLYTGQSDEDWELRITTAGLYTAFEATVYRGGTVIHGPWTPATTTPELIADGVSVIFTDGGSSSMTLGDKWVISNKTQVIKPVRVNVDGKLDTV